MAPPSQWTPAQLHQALASRADRVVGERLRVLDRAGTPVTCRAGCAACCRQLVVISPLEALAISDYVAARPELRARVEARVVALRERVAAEPALAAAFAAFDAVGGYVSPAAGDALERAYWAMQQACPFLEDERCAIYPARPFACREHFVISEPRLCAEDLDRVTPAGTRQEARAVAALVGEAFGLEDRLLWLVEALEYAAVHAPPEHAAVDADAGRRALEQGLARAGEAMAQLHRDPTGQVGSGESRSSPRGAINR